jgi:hypothetical protein
MLNLSTYELIKYTFNIENLMYYIFHCILMLIVDNHLRFTSPHEYYIY